MATQRIPLVVPTQPRFTSPLNINNTVDALSKDVVYDVVTNSATNTKTVNVMGREPELSFATDGSGETTAVVFWSGKGNYYSAFARGTTNSTVYVNDNSSSTNVGTTTGRVIHMSETVISGTPNIVVITDTGQTRFYPDGGSITTISDSDYPSNAGLTLTGNAVHINGKMCVMTTNPARLYESDINSLSSWGANNYISLQKLPDLGIGSIRYKDHVVCFGANSAEFLRDMGNPTPGSSFVSEGYINIGCVNQHAMVGWRDTVAFIGREGSNFGVYVLRGLSAEKISADWVDSYIQQWMTVASGAVANSIRLFIKQSDGHQYLVLGPGVLQVGSPTPPSFEAVYHDNINLWGMWSLDADFTYKTAPRTDVTLVATSVNAVMKNNVASRQAFSVRTGFFDLGTSRLKRFNRLAVVGPSPRTGASTDLTVTLYRDNEDSTVSRTLTASTSTPRPFSHRWGSARAIAVLISYSGAIQSKPNAMTLQAIDLDYDEASV